MKNLALIFGIVFISLISVNGQSINTENNEKDIYENSTELYDSIIQDYDNLFKTQTEQERVEDEEMESIYSDIFESFENIKLISEEMQEEQNNTNLYLAILSDLERE